MFFSGFEGERRLNKFSWVSWTNIDEDRKNIICNNKTNPIWIRIYQWVQFMLYLISSSWIISLIFVERKERNIVIVKIWKDWTKFQNFPSIWTMIFFMIILNANSILTLYHSIIGDECERHETSGSILWSFFLLLYH